MSYIRFANFSAGDGRGSQFIPKVNTEVIVNFLNGDPQEERKIRRERRGDERNRKHISAINSNRLIA